MTVLPVEIPFGKVVGRFLLAVADASDPDRLPDAKAPTGSITFTPITPNFKTGSPDVATVVRVPIRCALDGDGNLIDPERSPGVWLVVGQYRVTYSLADVSINGHVIDVAESHTDASPLDLTNALPPSGPSLTITQYAELSARLESMVRSVNGQLGDVTLFAIDVDAYTRAETDAALSLLVQQIPDAPVVSVAGKAGAVQLNTSDVDGFTESVQDAIAAFFNIVGAMINYDDANNQLIVTLPESGANPEEIRDLIGAAMFGVGLVTVSVNDAADTITISTTATQNSTDAQLRDRTTHTGLQQISTVEGLQAALTALNNSVANLTNLRGVTLIDTGGQVPAGTPSGFIVFEKLQVANWDFTQGSLPAGWSRVGGVTETFDENGMSANMNNGKGYQFNWPADLPDGCSFEIEVVAESALNASNMSGPFIMTSSYTGVGGTWYAAPQACLAVVSVNGVYNGAFKQTNAVVPFVPVRLRIRRVTTTSWWGGYSVDGGATWVETTEPVITGLATPPNKLFIGEVLGGAHVTKIKSAKYMPAQSSSSGRARGWWDGTSIQPLA